MACCRCLLSHGGRAGEESQRGVWAGRYMGSSALLSKPQPLSPGSGSGEDVSRPYPCLAVIPRLPTSENAHLLEVQQSDHQICRLDCDLTAQTSGQIPPLMLGLRSLRSAICLNRRAERIKENFKLPLLQPGLLNVPLRCGSWAASLLLQVFCSGPQVAQEPPSRFATSARGMVPGECRICLARSGTQSTSPSKYPGEPPGESGRPCLAQTCSRDPNTLVFPGRLPPALAITHGSSWQPQNCNISGMETGGRCREREQQLLKETDFLRLLLVLQPPDSGTWPAGGRSGTQRTGAGSDHEPLALQELKQARGSPGSGPRCVLKLEGGEMRAGPRCGGQISSVRDE